MQWCHQMVPGIMLWLANPALASEMTSQCSQAR